MSMAMRIIVADEHEITRRGVKVLLADLPVDIIAETTSGSETLEKVSSLSPDLLLLEVRFPDMDGFQVLQELSQDNSPTAVAVLSTYEYPTYIARSIIWGARDYLPKGMPTRDLKEALARFTAGEPAHPDSLFARYQSLLARRRDRGGLRGTDLTYREYQLLRHIALGLSNHEITRSLGISIETVKEHVQNVLRKTDASDRTQLAVWATQEELV